VAGLRPDVWLALLPLIGGSVQQRGSQMVLEVNFKQQVTSGSYLFYVTFFFNLSSSPSSFSSLSYSYSSSNSFSSSRSFNFFYSSSSSSFSFLLIFFLFFFFSSSSSPSSPLFVRRG